MHIYIYIYTYYIYIYINGKPSTSQSAHMCPDFELRTVEVHVLLSLFDCSFLLVFSTLLSAAASSITYIIIYKQCVCVYIYIYRERSIDR